MKIPEELQTAPRKNEKDLFSKLRALDKQYLGEQTILVSIKVLVSIAKSLL